VLAVLRGSHLRHEARCVGGLRAVLGHGKGCGLRLPQAEAPSMVAWNVIHLGPEPHRWGSGPFALQRGVGYSDKRSWCLVCTHHLEIPRHSSYRCK
jgi:hypothetical protein